MKWQYKVIEFTRLKFLTGRVAIEEVNEKLNELGANGWEVMSCAPAGGFGKRTVLAVLKRPL